MKAGFQDVYARVRDAVAEEPRVAARLVTGSLMHALGHAAVAGAAGACVRALSGATRPVGVGSTAAIGRFFSTDDARLIAAVGLLAVVVKVGAQIIATQAEVALAKGVGDRLRLEVLDEWFQRHRLRSVGHADQGGAPVAQSAADADVHPATVAARATLHVGDVEQGVVKGVVARARAVVELVPLLALLLVQNARLALAAALVLLPFVVATGRARKLVKRELAKTTDEIDALATAADEAVRHADLWTVFGAEARVRKSVASLGTALRKRAARVAALAAATSGANEILAALALVLVACAARSHLFGLDDGALLPFMVVFFLAYKPLRSLAEARFAIAKADAILTTTTTTPTPTSTSTSTSTPTPNSLVVDRLRIRNRETPLSFTLHPNESLAIIGPTGSGKTTLVRTLLGLERAGGGTITFGDARIDDAPAGPSTRPFSFVPQDAPLVCDTLEENIAIGGGADADAAALLSALGADSLVRALSTPGLLVGPGGRALSGGERQLVGIARAFASNAPIVILDEPTSGLDAETERAVIRFLAAAKKHRSLVIVSHKRAPLTMCDRVIDLAAPPLADAEASPPRARREPGKSAENAIIPPS
jgi:ABC-type multidrug transport system fused ATPase/permease subunit